MPRLVLIGGGHSHIEVLRRCAERPLPAEVILLDPSRSLPYTGMVPGYIAGLYEEGDIEIDIERLCEQASVSFKRSAACALDCTARTVTCEDGTTLSYDLLSIDAGSTLDMSTPGALENALPVRPLSRFIDAWKARAGDMPNAGLAVIGAGAAGIEIALAAQAGLRRRGGTPRIAVVGDATTLVPAFPRGARRQLARICAERAVTTHMGASVESVAPGAVKLRNGASVSAEWLIWATGPVPQPWLAASGLATDARGFVAVDTTLRSLSHPEVFAAGDTATIAGHERPRSGVYAVRAGPYLADNLQRMLRGEPLLDYRPQRRALALLGTGDRRAVGVYGVAAVEGAWVWRWKDAIDRAFVRRYRAG